VLPLFKKQLLVETPVCTECQHVFCEPCLGEWFKRKQSCPKCNASLERAVRGGQVRPLQQASPLAFRILLRVRVRCPLAARGVACAWRGDYSEVQSHLTSADAHLSSSGGSGSSGSNPSGSALPPVASARASAQAAVAAAGAAWAMDEDDEDGLVVDGHSSSDDDDDGGGGVGSSVGSGVGSSGLGAAADRRPATARPRVPTQPPAGAANAPGSINGSNGSSSSSSSNAGSALATSTALKDEADEKFSAKRFGEAAALYSKALAVAGELPDATAAVAPPAAKLAALCHTNRAACFFMLRQFRKCADDCAQAVRLDPAYVKVRA
jgi:hypothetical protein